MPSRQADQFRIFISKVKFFFCHLFNYLFNSLNVILNNYESYKLRYIVYNIVLVVYLFS